MVSRQPERYGISGSAFYLGLNGRAALRLPRTLRACGYAPHCIHPQSPPQSPG